jgi:thiamine-monophosphate kinase
MDEFGLINTYFARAAIGSDVLLGIGDDCAIVQPPEGRQLVMSIDTMVDGVHFPTDTPPERIGWRVMCAALSDLAAMGATPHWFTLALTLPEPDQEWVAAFADGIFAVANRFDLSLIGGDTTRGPLCITVQVHGSVEPGKALRRAGARPGDSIFVTGNLGDGAAALAVIQKKLTVAAGSFSYLLKRFYGPTPRITEGQLLVGTASAAIDISDGLYADLSKICEASGVGAEISVESLPISEHWRNAASPDRAQMWALTGGDDYQLCFTVPPSQVKKVGKWIEDGRLVATEIGTITDKYEVVVLKNGKPMELERRGYNHFG